MHILAHNFLNIKLSEWGIIQQLNNVLCGICTGLQAGAPASSESLTWVCLEVWDLPHSLS